MNLAKINDRLETTEDTQRINIMSERMNPNVTFWRGKARKLLSWEIEEPKTEAARDAQVMKSLPSFSIDAVLLTGVGISITLTPRFLPRRASKYSLRACHLPPSLLFFSFILIKNWCWKRIKNRSPLSFATAVYITK